MSLDKIINLDLLSWRNILAIGAILFFWASIAFMYRSLTGGASGDAA